MKYELLKRSHVKRNILIAVVVVFVLSAIILNFTRAKYRTTQSMPLIQGTINFSPSDLKIEDAAFTYENGLLGFYNLNRKGTKCSVYFDLIPDSENPVINNISSKSDNDISVTIEINATDNIGIYYYYYKIDNEEEIRSEENSYTFDNLEKDSVHTITVRVVDAAGNEASATDEVTVGLNAGRYILASGNAKQQTGQIMDKVLLITILELIQITGYSLEQIVVENHYIGES